MAGAVIKAGGESPAREYERYRGVVLGMLGKRFPRLDESEHLSIYHDAWARLLGKRERGEQIENLRAYLLATCAAEALHAVSRAKPPAPIGPDDPRLTTLAADEAAVEEQVVLRDQARIARDLLDSLEQRQRDVLKLRWDLQLSGTEIRAALGLSRRQYQRLVEEGAIAIAERVEQLKNGSWSRRQRSLVTACLIEVTQDGERRNGIASESQRKEAQRLLKSDPHFAALFAEVRGAIKRVAVVLPLPAVFPAAGEASAATRVVHALSDARDQAAGALQAAKQQSISLYLRVGDPTTFAGPRPGAAVAAIAGCLAIGGGAYGAYEGIKQPVPAVSAAAPMAPPALKAIDAPGPETPQKPKRPEKPQPKKPPEPLVANSVSPAPSPTSAPLQPPAPTPPPPAPSGEFGFEE